MRLWPFERNRSLMNPWQNFGKEDSWHKQHVMPPCSVQNKLHLVGLDYNQSLVVHKRNPNLLAIGHPIRPPLEDTKWVSSRLEMESLEFLVSMEP